jgi:hypothetical protein
MAEKTVHVGIAYRDQPGIRVYPKEGPGLSVEAFRDWLWDQKNRWVRVTLETLDGDPGDEPR